MIDADSAQEAGVVSRPGPQADDTYRSVWPHVVSVAWLVAVAAAVLGPALAHGASFGSYDNLSQFGLLQQSGTVVHNVQAGDQSDQIIPWATLAWTQVHHGQLPLWNPYEALGMPLAFNWQTAAFSVPSLIGYLFPLHLAFTAQVVVTLVIAGTGVYALCRVLHLGALASVFAATVFELSGPMLGWLGWPHAAVLSWSGWLFAIALLVVRGQHRLRYVTLLALVIAAMVFAGQAEILTLSGLALLVFLIAILGLRAPRLGGSGAIRRPILDLSIGIVTGLALSSPLLLPGLQVISRSQRAVPGGDPAEILKGNPALPLPNLAHFIFQGFNGLPVAGNHWFGYVGGYSETAAYVGVIALVLAVVAVAVRRCQPEVLAFGLLVLVMLAVAFLPPLVAILYRLPLVGTVLWQRAILPVAFGVAVLAGVGLDAVVHAHDDRAVRRWTAGGFGVAGLVLAGLWLLGRGNLAPAERTIRAHSFIWPIIETVLGLAVVGTLIWVHDRSVTSHPRAEFLRRHRGPLAGSLLLLCETAFLISAGSSLWSSSSTPFAPTPAEVALKGVVGTSLVGLGGFLCVLPPGLGLPENAQVAYGIDELALYDPMIPSTYYSSWRRVSKTPAGIPDDSVYCPGVSTAKLARLFGVGYVVERAGTPGPQGGVLVKAVGDESVYRIPDSALATLTPLSAHGRLPATFAAGTPVRVSRPDPASWDLHTDTARDEVLRLRLTNLPGWHASIDGRAVPLQGFLGVMLQLKVPPGRHVIKLYYWPATFSLGIVLGVCAAVGLVVAWIFQFAQRRRSAPPEGD